MPDSGEHGPRPVEDWEVQNLRLTLFPVEGFEPAQMNWLENVIDKPPERRETRPSQKTFIDVGESDNGRLVNVLTPKRIDWQLSAIEKKGTPFDTVGPLPEVLSLFTTKLKGWLEGSAPRLHRVALGAKIFLGVGTRLEGNSVLGAYLPALGIDDPENSTDILYRINRRRPSKVLDGWKVNRLCTWTVIEGVVAEIAAGRPAESELPINVQQVGERASACHIELDVNTDQDYKGPIPANLLGSILDELSTVAMELVAKGDIP